MEVFSKGVVVTVTLFPLWTGSMTVIGTVMLVTNHSHFHTRRNKSVKAGVYFWNSETKPFKYSP